MSCKPHFSLGTLVLVRYSTYPIWPGTIQRNSTPGYNRFVDLHPNRGGEEVISYWVVFSGDMEGGWVPINHIISYHPDLVYLARVSHRDGWHNDQARALDIAGRQYQALFSGNSKPPSLSKTDVKSMHRLLELYHFGDDGGSGDIMPTYVEPHQRRHPNPQISPLKAEPSSPKEEPTLEALTYHPPRRAGRPIKKKPQTRTKRVMSRTRGTASLQQKIDDLRECLRRRDAQITELRKETRRLRASRTSHLRQALLERENEITRLRQEAVELRKTRSVTPASRIPTFERLERCTNVRSFKQAAGGLQNKFTSFCGSVTAYANALEQLHDTRSTLSNAYQALRERTQITEVEVIDAEKALRTFADMLKEIRFTSSSDDAVAICR